VLFTFQLLCLLLSVALMVSWHWDILYWFYYCTGFKASGSSLIKFWC